MKIMQLEKLGSFHLERVLVKYDYPILFVCQNEKGKLMLFLEMDNTPEYEKWVAVNTYEKIINRLCRKDLSIQNSFINTDISKYYIVSHLFSDDSFRYETISKMPEGVLEPGDDFVEVENNFEHILKSASAVAERSNSSVLDIHLNPYTHRHSISASLLSFITSKINTAFNYSTNRKNGDLMVEFQPGSFVLRFYCNSKSESIIPSETSDNAFKTIGNLLSADDVENMSSDLIQTPKIINPTKELINRLSKEKEDFDIFITSENKSEPIVKKVNIEKLSDVNKKLKEYEIKDPVQKDIIGELTAYDSNKRTFGFLSDEGEHIKGVWDKGFIDKQYTIHNKYKATIYVIEETYNLNGSKSKKTNKLISLINQ